jgi:leucyl-tRNA synthetase
VEEQVTVVLQVNGRVRDVVTAATGLERDAALQLALDSENVRRHLDGRPVRHVVFVPDRLVNLVV